MPNPPKPIEQKRRAGTLRPDRMPASVGSLAVVPALDRASWELSPDEAFERVVSAGAAWISETDSPMVAMLRQALEERASLREAVFSGHGKRTELRELDKQIVGMLSTLGFDPTARARLGLAEVKAASTLEKLKAGRAAKG